MTRQDIVNELQGMKNIRIKFFEKSPYQARRYKPEFVESEAWIYTPNCQFGYLITMEDYNNKEYRKEFFDMIREENSGEAK